MKNPAVNGSKKRGAALITSFIMLSLIAIAGTSYVNTTTQAMRKSTRLLSDTQTTNLCDGGVQQKLNALWQPFKAAQNFTALDAALTGASASSPKSSSTDLVPNAGRFSCGVIGYATDPNDNYVRYVTVRSVGWNDRDNDGVLDTNEPRKTVDVTAIFELERSQIFDYTYFINNYGWMDGFGVNDLVVNGDMRANGNFNFLNGSPTVNGSVYAAENSKLTPAAAGLLNYAPVKMAQNTYASWAPAAPAKLSGETTADYNTRVAAYLAMNNQRRRPSYSSALHGAAGTSAFANSRDLVFKTDGTMEGGRAAGAVIADAEGTRAWTRTGVSSTPTVSMLDTQNTKEIVMPDLSNLTYYQNVSSSFVDRKATFADGTANPYYNQGAFVQVWNDTTKAYQTLSTNGKITGSAVLVGTVDHPIKVHGPVTASQDIIIKGYVDGQGTLYSGRNVHVVGSVKYKNPPDFTPSSLTAADNANSSRTFLGLAARGSVVMGNPSTFTNTTLQYMTPINPPSKNVGTYGRYDDAGNWVPPYDANAIDSTGFRNYQSCVAASTINSLAEGVNQIDAIMYSNFVGGGNVGTAGGGLVLNGTIISRDEAIVTYSLPIIMNYDNRIRERSATSQPLIDLQLPRSPAMLRSSWQDRGFDFGH